MRPLPQDSWQRAWQQAAALAAQDLQGADLAGQCARSGAIWKPDPGVIEIPLLDQLCQVRPPGFEVVRAEDGTAVEIAVEILLLHYLKTASGAPLAGEWITFAQVPGGANYLPNFRARTIDRLVHAYQGWEEALLEAARPLGGCSAGYGDASVLVRALPRVPVVLLLRRGDEEFPPSGNVLFDATASCYLPTEDLIVLAGMIVSRLCAGEGARG